ncbi:MAG TPA: pitrilysin family protein [Alphaproteobacteria bacterium]|nr:pitrilysin family protein [Alphaproteobacteria bacterium]
MDIQEAQLDNGMKVVVVPDHRSPVVTHSVWYRVGAVDEPTGATGMSHMLEHLMFKGTQKYPAGQMDKIIQRNGGQQNAFTSYEMTAYHQTISADKLPLMMEIEADRMEGLVLTDKVFLPERQVVSEERKWRIESQPAPGFYERLRRAHFQVSPFGREVIGSRADIEAYDLPRILNWYTRHYAPNNATLLVVGDVDMATVLPLAKQYYGGEKKRDVPTRKLETEPLRKAEVRLVEVNKDVQVPVYARMYRAPSTFVGMGDTPGNLHDAMALWALGEILGGSDTARLYQQLVVKQGLADGANANYDPTGGSESSLDVSVSPRTGVTLDKIDAAVLAVVADVLKSGVTEAELKRAKTNLMADEIYSLDNADNIMYRLGSWLMSGGTVKNFDAWQPVLKAITVADVNAAAHKYLVRSESTMGVLVGNEKLLGTLKPEAPAIVQPMAEAAKAAAKQAKVPPSPEMLKAFTH